MSRVALVLAIHNHQPVGNFDHVLENAYQSAYLPFASLLMENPHIRISLHNSGWLWLWLAKNRPEYLEMIKVMVQRGQIDLLTGGFYEPVMSITPPWDRIGQIKKLSDFLAEKFDYQPRGMWLAERVWEPQFPSFLADAGVEYVIVDDYHFLRSGLDSEQLNGYFVTEDAGKSVKVFPSSEALRYAIPFHPVAEVMEILQNSRRQDGDKVSLQFMGDDGEKFGVWPGTNKSVYGEGWLTELFEAVSKNSDWLDSRNLREYADSEPPRGRVYLPATAYMEMGQWSMPAERMTQLEGLIDDFKKRDSGPDWRQMLGGGFFRNFLSKYPESNQLQKKMLDLSRRVRKYFEKLPQAVREQVLDLLYRGQCNDVYWHGVFGGLYLPHLRAAANNNLIEGERILDEQLHGTEDWTTVRREDFDADGFEEIKVSTPSLSLLFIPHSGGALAEFDYKPKAFNIMNVLSRRPEGYHAEIIKAGATEKGDDDKARTIHDGIKMKEENLERYLVYDPFRRLALLDHLLPPEVSFEQFKQNDCPFNLELLTGPYSTSVETAPSLSTITFSADCMYASGNNRIPVQIVKRIEINSSGPGLVAKYKLTNSGDARIDAIFGVEWSFNLLAGNAPDRYFDIPGNELDPKILSSSGVLNDVSEISMVDEWVGIRITLKTSPACTFWRTPIESVSLSESGVERIYQGSILFPHFRISVLPGENFIGEFRLNVGEFR